jgi:L-iditol 2-dehydrogenase
LSTVQSEPEQVAPIATPALMKAAVYRGQGEVRLESIALPEIGPGEILIRVEACGICHTDLKKVEYDLLPPPRVYGHETAGVVAQVGPGVTRFAPGDRVIAFHHIPCGDCFYCQRKLYAQCAVYKRVGVTAGFEAAGGGFSQYVRVMDWIVERGVEKIPDGVSFEQASFVEPVNTCVKAVHQARPQPGDLVAILGQGPIGLIFTMLIRRLGCRILATDTMPRRLELSRRFGADQAVNPREQDVAAIAKQMSEGRGADLVILATSAPGLVEQAVRSSRPGAQILLFAQTSDQERIDLSGADICKDERLMYGCYSASVDLQKESADLVFSGELPVAQLISHCLPLEQIAEGFDLALHPTGESLKIVVQPQRGL